MFVTTKEAAARGGYMFTRKQYMNKECTHSEYYSQFADVFKAVLRRYETPEDWKIALAEDKHLNNIRLKFWDILSEQHRPEIAAINKKINGIAFWSLSDGVCAAKEAARQIAMEE